MAKLTRGTAYEIQFQNDMGQWCLYSQKAMLTDAKKLAEDLRRDDRNNPVRIVDCNGDVCDPEPTYHS